jgi:hypothetical protein
MNLRYSFGEDRSYDLRDTVFSFSRPFLRPPSWIFDETGILRAAAFPSDCTKLGLKLDEDRSNGIKNIAIYVYQHFSGGHLGFFGHTGSGLLFLCF